MHVLVSKNGPCFCAPAVIPSLPDQSEAHYLTGPDQIGFVLPPAGPGTEGFNFTFRHRSRPRTSVAPYSRWQTTGQTVTLSPRPKIVPVTGLPSDSDVQTQLTGTDETGRTIQGPTVEATTLPAGIVALGLSSHIMNDNQPDK